MKRIILIAFFLLIMKVSISPASLQSLFEGYVDNYTSAQTYHTQERGFYTLGGYTARWPMSTVNIFHVTPPRFEAGCGGIDIMWGAFNLINLDELVNKFQQVVAAAPPYAFQIAFQQLCQPCAYAMGAIEATSDFLNSLNFDQCKAAQMLGEKLASLAAEIPGMASLGFKEGTVDVKESVYEQTKQWLSSPVSTFIDFINNKITDTEKKEKILGNNAGGVYDNFVLEEALEDTITAQDYRDFIRLLIGDVHIKYDPNQTDTGPAVEPIPAGCINATQDCGTIACPQTPADAIKYLAGGSGSPDGKSWLCGKTTSNVCYCSQLDPGYTDHIISLLQSIYNKVDTADTLTDEEQTLVNTSTLPVIPVLQTEKRITKGAGYTGLVPALAEAIAWDWVNGAVDKTISAVITELEKVYMQMIHGDTEAEELVSSALKQMLKNARDVRKEYHNIYRSVLAGLNTKLNTISALIRIRESAEQLLSESNTGKTFMYFGKLK